MFVVNRLLEGCVRAKGHSRDARRPITKSILTEIIAALPSVCYNEFEAKVFKAIFSMAYFGLFRISELVATTLSGSSNQIKRKDVAITTNEQFMSVTLRIHKTSQHGPPITLKLPREKTHPCPVLAMLEYLSLKPAGTSAFSHSNGLPVTRQQVTAVLNKCLTRAGHSTQNFKTHSFRIGRATDLAIRGVPETDIMKLGRWSSQAYKKYIRV